MMQQVFVLTRLLQYGAAVATCGTALFLVYGYHPSDPSAWRRWIGRAALIGVLGTLAWLMAQAGALGEPSDALATGKVWEVAAGTGFGRAALVRLLLFLLAALFASRGAWNGTALLGILASASFAFTGHAAGGEGVFGLIGVVADMVHAIAAAIWLGALPALLMLLWRPAVSTSIAAARAGLEAFSRIGVLVVVTLGLTGLMNIWLLLKAYTFAEISSALYGRVLVVKMVMFAAMLLLACLNRFWWTPRLTLSPDPPTAALRGSLLCETILGLGVLCAVSILGTLSPA